MNHRKSKRRESFYVPSSSVTDESKTKKLKRVPESETVDRNNLLHSCLKKAGMNLQDGELQNRLSTSKAVFQKKLSVTLKNHHGDLLQNIDTFIQELGEYIEEPQRFNKSLMPCSMSTENENASTVPDSAIRLLLGVELIQSPLMVLLLDKLLVYWGEEEDYIFHQKQMVYIPRLLLSQFRFLDCIVDGKEVTNKLLTVLSSVSLEVQKEILACIPDIVEDSEHGDVALKLREELTSNKDLTCAIIDTLTYLNISEEQVMQVRTAVVDMLNTFSVNDLPIVVKFLLESITAQDALEIVNEIRSNVCFVFSSRLSAEELEKLHSSAKMTVDALKSRMQSQRHVAEAWIKALDSAQTAQTLDMFVLLILHWFNHKKPVESLLRNKIRAGLVSDASLCKLFTAHTQIVRDYFPSILSLAQTLVRSMEPRVCLIGASLYTLAFIHFDAYCKQEVVASLLTHIGNGQSGEIDASLNILTGLVKEKLKEMSRFAVFIKGALDYLDHNNLSISHIKKLYLLLAELAFKQSKDGNYLQDDLHIIIRKQLTSADVKYKRMGVIGAISIVQALAGKSEENPEKKLGKEQYQQVVDLLELVRSSCSRDAEMTALFLDSLAATLTTQRLGENIETWIADNMTEAFEGTFVKDLEDLDELQKNCSVSIERLYNLNDEAQSTIFIDLVPLIEKMMNKIAAPSVKAENSPLCLAPLFRLITQCERLQSNNDLENIDALLGCPILMIKPDVYDSFTALSPKEKDIVCNSLFFCINWTREVVNSFGPMSSAEMRGKVIQRLRLISNLNTHLSHCLAQNTSFIPPAAIFELDTSSSGVKAPPSGTSIGDKKTSGTGKGKKGKKQQKKKNGTIDETLAVSTQEDGDITLTQSLVESSNNTAPKTGSGKPGNTAVDMTMYRHFFRELDISVFSVLKAGLVKRWPASSAIDTNITENKEFHLDLPELVFLLEDLDMKLKHSLVSVSSSGRGRPAGFGAPKGADSKKAEFVNLDQYNPADIAKKMALLFPVMTDFLEEMCTFFQTQEQMNRDEEEDEDLDASPVKSSEDTKKMSECFHYLLKSSLSLFSWEGFRNEEHQEIFGKMMSVAVVKLRPGDGSTSSSYVPQQEKIRWTFQYFSNLVEATPNLSTGVTLIKLLKVLVDMCSDNQDMKAKLVKHAKVFLNQEWKGPDGDLLKGANHNLDVQMILQTYISSSTSPLETLEDLASQSMASMVNVDKNGHAEEIACLNRWTYPVFYKVLLTELISNGKRIKTSKKSDSIEILEERLLSWTMAVKVLYVAVSLTKVFNARSNLSAALKLGRQFVEVFLRLGMPLMDITFRRRHAQVEKLLRSVQQSTRMLQHLSSHSKINNDVGLTNQVPMLKRALETFVFRVRAMLALNACEDAFWVGNLKNRNLKGEEILTQTSVASSGNVTANDDDDEEEEEEENDENIAENEDSEVEVEESRGPQEDSNADGGSYSEIF